MGSNYLVKTTVTKTVADIPPQLVTVRDVIIGNQCLTTHLQPSESFRQHCSTNAVSSMNADE